MMKETDRPFGHVSGIEYREETDEIRNMLPDRLSSPDGSFSAFSGFGIPIFLLIVLCLYEVQKERRVGAAVPYVLPLMLCLACIASPVYDCGRYCLGIFYIMPFVFGAAVRRGGFSSCPPETPE